MARDMFDTLSTEISGNPFIKDQQVRPAPKQPVKPKSYDLFDQELVNMGIDPDKGQRSLHEAFTRGGMAGMSGLLLGYKPKEAPNDENWLEHLASLAGELISDAPGFWIGGELGAMAGSAIGSVVPGIGTAGGAAAGAVSGAMAFPVMIKHSFQEYRDFVKQGSNLSYGDFLERAGRTTKETAKAGAIGIATAGMSKFLPFLKKIPKFDKLLNTKPGRIAAGAALEYTGLTGSQAALEGKLPTAQQMGDNAAVLLGLKLTHGAKAKSKEFLTALAKPTTKTRTHALLKAMPKSITKIIRRRYPELGDETTTQRLKAILRKAVGTRNAAVFELQADLNENFENVLRANPGNKVSAQALEEMMYYKQRTGNPFIENDAPSALAGRLTPAERRYVDTFVTKHFDDMLKLWNSHPRMKKINPRDVVRELYMPGFFEYDPKLFRKLLKDAPREFKIDQRIANFKEFITFKEAYREAGLKPRYRNINELIDAYDKMVVKSLTNMQLLDDIALHEKEYPGEKLVVNAFDSKAYKEAKALGYTQMDDVFLRTHALTETKTGKFPKQMWKISDAPALVHPDFAKMFQGVFTKDAYKSPTKIDEFLEKTDKLRDIIRFTRVEVSPFHYFSLFESKFASDLGLTKGFSKRGEELLKSRASVSDAIEHGLKLDYRVQEYGGEKATGLISRATDLMIDAANKLPNNLASRTARKYLQKIKGSANHLFDVFHPRLKMAMYDEYVNTEIKKVFKNDGFLTEENIKQIKYDIADVVNNMTGGQNWEYMNFFNSKKNLTSLRRLVGYPDWTVSTIRQFLDMTSPGVKGKMARRAWKRYGLVMAGIQGGLRFLNYGWEQTDKKDKSITGLRWSPTKALKGLVAGGPTWYMFPLPDVDIRLPRTNRIINPGRDARGRKLVGHFGKQALEIGRYFKDPVGAFFSKTNPLIQMATDQVLGGTPRAGGGMWMAEPAWKYGRQVPWQGKEGIAQIPSRAKHLLRGLVPYSMTTLTNKGMATYVSSLFGAFPVSQAITEYSATPFIEDAIRETDNVRSKEKLDSIRNLMSAGGIPDRSIRRRISTVRNAIEEHKVKDELTTAVRLRDIRKINKIKRRLMARGVSGRKVNAMIKKANSPA